MLDPQKTTMGRVRQAYDLNNNEVEKVIQALWPDNVFPVELWRRAHATYWRGFADSNQVVYNIESPALPEIDMSAKYFHPHLCALDVQMFFRKLSLNIQVNTLREGLNFILEESYEDIDAVFSEERDFLFSTLERLETTDVFEQYSQASELFEEKILSVPISSYHFISHIFYDTVLVDKVAVIFLLRNYPLRRGVKGITRALVDSIINPQAQEAVAPKTPASPMEQTTKVLSQTPPNGIPVPRSLWEGKTRETIVTAMRAAGFDDEVVIAHVIFFKRKIKGKRAVGALLGPPNRSYFLYDKKGSELYEKAKLITIVDKDEF